MKATFDKSKKQASHNFVPPYSDPVNFQALIGLYADYDGSINELMRITYKIETLNECDLVNFVVSCPDKGVNVDSWMGGNLPDAMERLFRESGFQFNAPIETREDVCHAMIAAMDALLPRSTPYTVVAAGAPDLTRAVADGLRFHRRGSTPAISATL